MDGSMVLLGTIILYVGAGVVLLAQWKPFRAGAAMMAVTPLPLVWQIYFTDSDAPGFVFLFFVMLMPPVAMMMLGAVAALYRYLYPDGEWA